MTEEIDPVEELVEDDQIEDEGDPAPEPDPAREELEAQARKYGWRPQGDFDRAPASWVDAERFMELPATNVKVVRDENKALQKRIDDQAAAHEARIAEVERGTKMAVTRVREQEQARYEADLAAVRLKKREAVDMADARAYDAAELQEQSLKAPGADDYSQGPQPAVDPYVTQYAEANDWLKNPILYDTARRMIDASPSVMAMGAKEQIAYAEAEVRKMYPAYFPAQATTPARAPRVDGGGLGTGRASGRGADDLPADVRRIAKEFVAEGVFKSVDEYARDYFAQEGGR